LKNHTISALQLNGKRWNHLPVNNNFPEGLFGKWRIEVDGRGLKGILKNFEL
jgi:hypothetical protein